MTVRRTYEGYPPDTQHWAPGDGQPADYTTLYDNADRPWSRPQSRQRWMRRLNRLAWPELVQQHGPMHSAPRESSGQDRG